PCVPDEQRGRRQSAKPATDDMCLHRPPPWTSGFGGAPDQSPLEQSNGGLEPKQEGNTFPVGACLMAERSLARGNPLRQAATPCARPARRCRAGSTAQCVS